MRRKRIIEMSSFGDDPIKDLGFVVFPASAGLDQRDCLFCAFSLHLWKIKLRPAYSFLSSIMRGALAITGCISLR